jgi:riboflavin biosynthesis pyrimidine reductase
VLFRELPDEAELARLHAYPPELPAGRAGGPWVRANMVASADGAVTVDGLSGGLSSPGDRTLFWVLRGLADVVVAGAGTARAEGYHPTTGKDFWGPLRLREGRPAAPPIALVSRSLEIVPAAPVIADAPPDARTIIITCASSPADRRAALAEATDVIVAGEDEVDLAAAMAALAARGLRRILCEGGPRLLADLVAAGAMNELCLTVSPVLAGPGAARILAGTPFPARRLELAHVLEEEGVLFCRYLTGADAR